MTAVSIRKDYLSRLDSSDVVSVTKVLKLHILERKACLGIEFRNIASLCRWSANFGAYESFITEFHNQVSRLFWERVVHQISLRSKLAQGVCAPSHGSPSPFGWRARLAWSNSTPRFKCPENVLSVFALERRHARRAHGAS